MSETLASEYGSHAMLPAVEHAARHVATYAPGMLGALQSRAVATLVHMSLQTTARRIFAIGVALLLLGTAGLPAMAAPSAVATAADRAAVDRAVEQYEAAQARSAEIETRLGASAVALDAAVAAENESREQLRSRVIAMYRTDDLDPVSVLLGASTLQDFVTRWDVLARIARQDADNLRKLKQARAAATRSAEQLMALQSEQAKALDELAAEVSRAKKELAASEAALRAYEARMAAGARPAAPAESTPAKESPTPPAPAREDPTQELTGTGEWKTAVASHYGRNFTGTGASGEKIGPYSMIVAHKTLPFGTLVEFNYKGKRAVARVADRGPYTAGRTFDLGPGVVRVLDFSGVHEVRYRIIAR